jgi:hypothetical protein
MRLVCSTRLCISLYIALEVFAIRYILCFLHIFGYLGADAVQGNVKDQIGVSRNTGTAWWVGAVSFGSRDK